MICSAIGPEPKHGQPLTSLTAGHAGHIFYNMGILRHAGAGTVTQGPWSMLTP